MSLQACSGQATAERRGEARWLAPTGRHENTRFWGWLYPWVLGQQELILVKSVENCHDHDRPRREEPAESTRTRRSWTSQDATTGVSRTMNCKGAERYFQVTYSYAVRSMCKYGWNIPRTDPCRIENTYTAVTGSYRFWVEDAWLEMSLGISIQL